MRTGGGGGREGSLFPTSPLLAHYIGCSCSSKLSNVGSRSLGLGEKERVVSASSEVIELLQEDSTKYLFTFHILAKLACTPHLKPIGCGV